MKFTVGLPVDRLEPKGAFQNFNALKQVSQAIERSGAYAAFLSEHPAPTAEWLLDDAQGHDTLDMFSALSFVAAVTDRLMVQTSIVVLPYRNPFLTAKSAATLQVLSGNRFILGVGAGYLKGEFDALGVDFSERGALTDEALETIRAAWSGDVVVKQGRHFNAAGNLPRPAPSVQPPIWVGGGSNSALKRAVEYGDGWFPIFTLPTDDVNLQVSGISSVADLKQKVAWLHQLREEKGKSGHFDIVISGKDEFGSRTASDADRYCAFVDELIDAGATCIVTRPLAGSPAEFCDHVAWFGEEVIARYQ